MIWLGAQFVAGWKFANAQTYPIVGSAMFNGPPIAGQSRLPRAAGVRRHLARGRGSRSTSTRSASSRSSGGAGSSATSRTSDDAARRAGSEPTSQPCSPTQPGTELDQTRAVADPRARRRLRARPAWSAVDAVTAATTTVRAPLTHAAHDRLVASGTGSGSLPSRRPASACCASGCSASSFFDVLLRKEVVRRPRRHPAAVLAPRRCDVAARPSRGRAARRLADPGRPGRAGYSPRCRGDRLSLPLRRTGSGRALSLLAMPRAVLG